MYEAALSSRSDAEYYVVISNLWILFSTYDESQNRHIGTDFEHMGLFFRKAGVPERCFRENSSAIFNLKP
jgi:hypothetical protein